MRKIQITLRTDGTQKVEVLGCTGEECLELTRAYEARAGWPIGERELKPEFFETEGETEREQVREGGR